MLTADENFTDLNLISIGDTNPLLGFSSFKFIPNLDDELIVAIKSKEYQDEISTYILVFDTNGKILLPETLVDNQIKFEGKNNLRLA